MAEPYIEASLESSEVRSPLSPTFSSFRDQGNTPKFKSFIMSKVNKEEPPRSPVIKPMPPLEPLDYSSKVAPQDCPSPLARLHPKKRRLDTGCEPEHQTLHETRDIPASLPPSPLSPGSCEDRYDLQGKMQPLASRPEKDCYQQINDFFPAHLLSPPLSLSTLSAVTSSSPSSFSVDSPRTFSAFREVSPSCGSIEDITFPEGVILTSKKRRRSPDSDTSKSESSDSLRALAKAYCDGAALDLSSSTQIHPIPDSLPPSCLPAHVQQRTTFVYGQSHGLVSVASKSQDETHTQYQPRLFVHPTENRSGLFFPSRPAGYPIGQLAGLAYPSGQQGSVIQLTGQHAGGVSHSPSQQPRGVAHPPSQQPRGVAHPPSQPRGVARPPSQPRGVTHPPSQPRGVTHLPGHLQGVTHPIGLVRGVTHPPNQPRGVTHLAGQPRGVTHPPSQSRGVTHPAGQPRGVTHPASQPRGVTHLPSQCGSVITHTTDPGRGMTHPGPTWSDGTQSLEQSEAGSGPLLSSLLGSCPMRPPRQVRPYAVGYDCDLTLEGGRHGVSSGAADNALHLRTLLQPQKTFPPPLFHTSGNQSRRMPSEISYGYPTSHDVPKSSLRMPSASSKKYEWSCSKREVEYPNKPVAKWTQEDVVDFIYAASSKLNCEDDEINGAVLSGMKGSCLLQLDENGFNQLCKKDGDKIYRYFQEYKAKEERRHLHIESHPQYFTNSHLYSLALELNGDKCTHQPHLDPRETAAPYEVRYETIDYRGLSFDDKSRNLLSSDKLPSAALKSFAPLTTMSPPDLSNGTAENMSDPEQSTSEEEPRPEPPKKRGPGRPRKPENELKKKKKKTGRLWEFIRNLLLDPATCPSLVRWENADEGMFRFVQAEKVAQKWGDRKQNKEMNYEKLSRAMRYYYKTHIFEAVLGRRLVYKFGKNAKDWRPSNPNFPDLQTH